MPGRGSRVILLIHHEDVFRRSTDKRALFRRQSSHQGTTDSTLQLPRPVGHGFHRAFDTRCLAKRFQEALGLALRVARRSALQSRMSSLASVCVSPCGRDLSRLTTFRAALGGRGGSGSCAGLVQHRAGFCAGPRGHNRDDGWIAVRHLRSSEGINTLRESMRRVVCIQRDRLFPLSKIA